MRVITTLQLNSPLLARPASLREALEKVVAATAFDIERGVKERMRAPKHGRTYRRGAITRKATRNTRALGLRERVTGRGQLSPEGFSLEKRRAVVGYKIHRASARGEAPAVDTSVLINSVKARPKGWRAEIGSPVGYAWLLEYVLDRPAFEPALEAARSPFQRKIDEAIARLI